MELEQLHDKGFDFLQINLLEQLSKIKGISALKPTVPVSDLRKLKTFLENHKTTTSINKILTKALNEKNASFLDSEGLNDIHDFTNVKSSYITKLYKCFTCGLEYDSSLRNATLTDFDYYLIFHKRGKNIKPLLGRNFSKEQIEVLSDYLSYDLSKFNSTFTPERMKFYGSCLEKGIDPFEDLNCSLNRRDIYLKAKLKGIDLSDCLDINPRSLKCLLELPPSAREKAKEFLRKGYTPNKTKCLLKLLDEKVDVSIYEQIENTNTLKEVIAFARNVVHDESLVKKMVEVYDESEYTALINVYKDLEEDGDIPYFEKFLKRKMSVEQISMASLAISRGQAFDEIFDCDFNFMQCEAIINAIHYGVDIESILNPMLPSDVMYAIAKLSNYGITVDISNFRLPRDV